MKWFPSTALALALFALGVLVGAQLHRYEHAIVGDYPARFDRWTGKLQIISFSVSDEFSQRLPVEHPPTRKATADKEWPGTPVPR